MRFFRRAKAQLQFRVWGKLRANHYHGFHLSHSLFGEDMVVRALLADVYRGFYVDIGAHHPVYSSNTYHFYERGWRGINIDAAPGSMEVFQLVRPEDVNLEACIAERPDEVVKFYVFADGLLNTADPDAAQKAQELGNPLLAIREMSTRTLTHVLEQHLPTNTAIDFLNIDVEGLDESILKSIDWKVYCPTVVAFECHDDVSNGFKDIPTLEFLRIKGYEFHAKCGSTLIVKRKDPRPAAKRHTFKLKNAEPPAPG
jgi:FkbM family methyltransferase